MVLVSEPYILTSAYRMVQVSKPCGHTDPTMRAYATLINSEFWRQCDTHLAPYTTGVAHCWSCQTDQMHYVWFAISVRWLLWSQIKSVTQSTMFPSTLNVASSGPVPRFWILVFCQEAFIANDTGFNGNLRALLTTDHQICWTVTALIFFTLVYTRFTAWIAAEEDPKTVKWIVEEDCQQKPHK